MFRRFNYFLMDAIVDPPASGGGAPPPTPPPTGTPAAGDPLFGNSTAPAGTPPAGGTPPPAGTPPTGVVIPENWQEAVPEDLRKQAFMTKYKTVDQLAKGYAHLEKMIGSDKIIAPPKGAPLAEMREYFERIGLPKDLAEYKLEGLDPAKVDPAFADAYRKISHELGVLPAQAKGLVDWFTKADEEARVALTNLQNKAIADDLAAYQAETGDAYSTEIARAKAALQTLDKKDQMFLEKSGLGKNTTIIRMLAKYGSHLSEGAVRGAGAPVDGAMTPGQAREKINEIKSSGPKHPYFDPNHTDHAKAKAEMQKYYGYAFPTNKPLDTKI